MILSYALKQSSERGDTSGARLAHEQLFALKETTAHFETTPEEAMIIASIKAESGKAEEKLRRSLANSQPQKRAMPDIVWSDQESEMIAEVFAEPTILAPTIELAGDVSQEIMALSPPLDSETSEANGGDKPQLQPQPQLEPEPEPEPEPQSESQTESQSQPTVVPPPPQSKPYFDAYGILGVDIDASKADIHKFFFMRARRLLISMKGLRRKDRRPHLDQLQAICIAHDILTDRVTRNDYDLRVLGYRGSPNEVTFSAPEDEREQRESVRTPLRIGELLQCAGLLEPSELEIAADMHKAMPEMLFGEFLVKQEFIKPADLEQVLMGQRLLKNGNLSIRNFQLVMKLWIEKGQPIWTTAVANEYVTKTEMDRLIAGGVKATHTRLPAPQPVINQQVAAQQDQEWSLKNAAPSWKDQLDWSAPEPEAAVPMSPFVSKEDDDGIGDFHPSFAFAADDDETTEVTLEVESHSVDKTEKRSLRSVVNQLHTGKNARNTLSRLAALTPPSANAPRQEPAAAASQAAPPAAPAGNKPQLLKPSESPGVEIIWDLGEETESETETQTLVDPTILAVAPPMEGSGKVQAKSLNDYEQSGSWDQTSFHIPADRAVNIDVTAGDADDARDADDNNSNDVKVTRREVAEFYQSDAVDYDDEDQIDYEFQALIIPDSVQEQIEPEPALSGSESMQSIEPVVVPEPDLASKKTARSPSAEPAELDSNIAKEQTESTGAEASKKTPSADSQSEADERAHPPAKEKSEKPAPEARSEKQKRSAETEELPFAENEPHRAFKKSNQFEPHLDRSEESGTWAELAREVENEAGEKSALEIYNEPEEFSPPGAPGSSEESGSWAELAVTAPGTDVSEFDRITEHSESVESPETVSHNTTASDRAELEELSEPSYETTTGETELQNWGEDGEDGDAFESDADAQSRTSKTYSEDSLVGGSKRRMRKSKAKAKRKLKKTTGSLPLPYDSQDKIPKLQSKASTPPASLPHDSSDSLPTLDSMLAEGEGDRENLFVHEERLADFEAPAEDLKEGYLAAPPSRIEGTQPADAAAAAGTTSLTHTAAEEFSATPQAGELPKRSELGWTNDSAYYQDVHDPESYYANHGYYQGEGYAHDESAHREYYQERAGQEYYQGDQGYGQEGTGGYYQGEGAYQEPGTGEGYYQSEGAYHEQGADAYQEQGTGAVYHQEGAAGVYHEQGTGNYTEQGEGYYQGEGSYNEQTGEGYYHGEGEGYYQGEGGYNEQGYNQQGYYSDAEGYSPDDYNYGHGKGQGHEQGYYQGGETYGESTEGQPYYHPEGYAAGQEGYAAGQEGYAAGQEGYAADQEGAGHDGYAAGQEGYTVGQEGYVAGQEGYAAGQEGYAAGQEGYAAGHDGYAAGQEGYTVGQEGYVAGQEGYAAGQEGYAAGQEGYAAGQEGYAAGQEGYAAGQEGYAAGQEGYYDNAEEGYYDAEGNYQHGEYHNEEGGYYQTEGEGYYQEGEESTTYHHDDSTKAKDSDEKEDTSKK